MLKMPFFLVRLVCTGRVGLQSYYGTIAIRSYGIRFALLQHRIDNLKQSIRVVMAKRKQIDEDLMESTDQRILEATMLLKRKSVKYKPLPKFKSGCKNC